MTAPTKSRAGSGAVQELPLEAPVASSAVAVQEQRPMPTLQVDQDGNIPPSQLIMAAIERGIPTESLEKLVALQERMEDRAAAREFAAAMAAFQAECPPITHSRKAKITTTTGGAYEYTYAELDAIAREINPILAKHGLSYAWDTSVDEKNRLTCGCTVRHLNGYVAAPATFSLPIDNKSAMSEQQKVGAAATFAKRQSLTAALGITTSDDDFDGGGASVDPRPITPKQLSEIEDLVADAQPDLARFLAHLGVEQLAQLPLSRYREAVSFLRQKIEKDKLKRAGTR